MISRPTILLLRSQFRFGMKRIHVTEQDALVFALACLKCLKISNLALAERYGLRANTLTDISMGKRITRGREKYMQSFVRELNCVRRVALKRGDAETETMVMRWLGEIMLVQYGLATDKEIAISERGDRLRIWIIGN